QDRQEGVVLRGRRRGQRRADGLRDRRQTLYRRRRWRQFPAQLQIRHLGHRLRPRLRLCQGRRRIVPAPPFLSSLSLSRVLLSCPVVSPPFRRFSPCCCRSPFPPQRRRITRCRAV